MNKPLRAIQPEVDENGNVFGEFDANKQHPFPPGWLDRVVVRQSNIERLSSGDIVEIPSSVRLINYEVANFNHMIKNELFADLQVKILHDPR